MLTFSQSDSRNSSKDHVSSHITPKPMKEYVKDHYSRKNQSFKDGMDTRDKFNSKILKPWTNSSLLLNGGQAMSLARNYSQNTFSCTKRKTLNNAPVARRNPPTGGNLSSPGLQDNLISNSISNAKINTKPSVSQSKISSVGGKSQEPERILSNYKENIDKLVEQRMAHLVSYVEKYKGAEGGGRTRTPVRPIVSSPANADSGCNNGSIAKVESDSHTPQISIPKAFVNIGSLFSSKPPSVKCSELSRIINLESKLTQLESLLVTSLSDLQSTLSNNFSIQLSTLTTRISTLESMISTGNMCNQCRHGQVKGGVDKGCERRSDVVGGFGKDGRRERRSGKIQATPQKKETLIASKVKKNSPQPNSAKASPVAVSKIINSISKNSSRSRNNSCSNKEESLNGSLRNISQPNNDKDRLSKYQSDQLFSAFEVKTSQPIVEDARGRDSVQLTTNRSAFSALDNNQLGDPTPTSHQPAGTPQVAQEPIVHIEVASPTPAPRQSLTQNSQSPCSEEVTLYIDEEMYLRERGGKYLLDDRGQRVTIEKDRLDWMIDNRVIEESTE